MERIISNLGVSCLLGAIHYTIASLFTAILYPYMVQCFKVGATNNCVTLPNMVKALHFSSLYNKYALLQ